MVTHRSVHELCIVVHVYKGVKEAMVPYHNDDPIGGMNLILAECLPHVSLPCWLEK